MLIAGPSLGGMRLLYRSRRIVVRAAAEERGMSRMAETLAVESAA